MGQQPNRAACCGLCGALQWPWRRQPAMGHRDQGPWASGQLLAPCHQDPPVGLQVCCTHTWAEKETGLRSQAHQVDTAGASKKGVMAEQSPKPCAGDCVRGERVTQHCSSRSAPVTLVGAGTAGLRTQVTEGPGTTSTPFSLGHGQVLKK